MSFIVLLSKVQLALINKKSKPVPFHLRGEELEMVYEDN